ncbi:MULTISPECIES: hypothetical protein [unclassified Nostoc]|uniref:hypothetical protein n=1 Tax=unclassified Nostoc TaxID=2593658 RepID=UPI002AD555BA|nr:hypothetical protein [Nostoc sp. DedQUE03]MDZ7975572.1 hypothetical protein [Nostoc sp. DedQUE03]MDZ8048783.1 hypothetical protein [Nostoc sp. DedQUE02]
MVKIAGRQKKEVAMIEEEFRSQNSEIRIKTRLKNTRYRGLTNAALSTSHIEYPTDS